MHATGTSSSTSSDSLLIFDPPLGGSYMHIVTRGDDLRALSNALADHAASLMERDGEGFDAAAQAADEIWALAQFIEPAREWPAITFTTNTQ